jgi:hypothetical protein
MGLRVFFFVNPENFTTIYNHFAEFGLEIHCRRELILIGGDSARRARIVGESPIGTRASIA